MRRVWDSYTTYYVRSASWLVAILFLLISLLIVLLIPPVVRDGPDHETLVLFVHIIAGVFAALGIFFLVGWLGDWYFEAYFPFYRPIWTFWYTFIGGLFAAGMFAVPAALALPILVFVYWLRPNVFFSASDMLSANGILAALFLSAIGLSCLGSLISWAVPRYRTRPVVEIVV